MHREFRTEWWYFTGNVSTEEGRRFGYQFTIFRYGIQPVPAQTNSQWAMRDVWFGHCTVTDIADNRFFQGDRTGRGALAQDGASEETFHVWLANRQWEITPEGDPGPDGDVATLTVRASQPDFGIDFTLRVVKPKIFHGPEGTGLSQKSAAPGNASHYYSYTRLATSGTIRLGEREYAVSGTSWFDHEFSTSALAQDQAGWDWFSIQLDDGTELMVYAMRKTNGTIDAASKGSVVATDSGKTHLTRKDFAVEALGTWTSPHTGAVYPSGWRVRVPQAGLDLKVTPRTDDQEVRAAGPPAIVYWEGACAVEGTKHGQPITGVGYTELSGYYKPLSDGVK